MRFHPDSEVLVHNDAAAHGYWGVLLLHAQRLAAYPQLMTDARALAFTSFDNIPAKPSIEGPLLHPLPIHEWRFSNDAAANQRTRSSQRGKNPTDRHKQPRLTTDQRG